MRPAVKIDQAVGLLPGGLVNGVEVAGDDQLPRPFILIRGELPGFPVDAGVPGQDRPGPRGVHHEAGGVRAQEHPQPPLRRAVPLAGGEDPPRRLVRMQVPGAPRPPPAPPPQGAPAPPAARPPPARAPRAFGGRGGAPPPPRGFFPPPPPNP